ncbi:MAG TPA: dihydrofolate reductase [Devosia sp.]|jgi:dihydrofolate reductase|nr:dihydrofolate reductase [Devosia sp.]
MTAKIAMIAGVAENGVIGSDQTIPWRVPSDMAFFKRTTMGKPIIMGRKQFETVGKPLPGRSNIVITRRADYRPDGVLVFHDITTAVERAREIAAMDGVDEIMIIGGGEIYAQMMERADRLYITHIDLNPAGDVLFPAITPDWVIVDLPEVEPSPRDEATYRVKVYERRVAPAH